MVMAKTHPAQFIQEVRQEVARVTWPSRKESLTTTVMVFVMVFIAAGSGSQSSNGAMGSGSTGSRISAG